MVIGLHILRFLGLHIFWNVVVFCEMSVSCHCVRPLEPPYKTFQGQESITWLVSFLPPIFLLPIQDTSPFNWEKIKVTLQFAPAAKWICLFHTVYNGENPCISIMCQEESVYREKRSNQWCFSFVWHHWLFFSSSTWRSRSANGALTN